MKFVEFKEKYEKKKVLEVPSRSSENPLVSICIQTYNHGEFLKECLESVLSQQVNFDFEVLLGEDNSTDETRQVCLEFAEKFPEKIRLFLHHRENQIPVMGEATSNFNAFYNLFSAKGKYIAFCEGDDFWDDPFKLEKQVDFLEKNSSYVFTYHMYREVNRNGKKSEHPESIIQPIKDISAEALKKGESHPLLLTICFRNIIREIPKEILEVINVDTFLLSLLGQYGGAKFLSAINPACYRKHEGGIWSKQIKKKKFLSKINTYGKLAEYYEGIKDPQLADFYKLKIRDSYKMLISLLLKQGEFIGAIKATQKLTKI